MEEVLILLDWFDIIEKCSSRLLTRQFFFTSAQLLPNEIKF